MRYSVVIPVFEEEDSIVAVIAELRAARLDPSPLEVIVIDDGSRDRTAARVEALCAADPRLVLVGHPRRCGKSAAILSGVRAAEGD